MFNLDYFLVTDITSYRSMPQKAQHSTLSGGIDKQSSLFSMEHVLWTIE